MPGEIALSVAHDIQPTNHPPALYRLLPDGGVDCFASPGDIARKTDVDGQQSGQGHAVSDVPS
jgi:hypothetical protein